jgi:uncharacterized membrane protein
MHHSGFYYPPLTLPFYLALFVLFAVAVVVIEVGLVHYASERLGIGRRLIYLLLLLSLVGSYVNIPVARLPGERVETERVVSSYFGIRYAVPVIEESPGTVLAVNLGGAVIPTILSGYLLIKNRLYLEGLLGTVVVATVVHMVASPVRGVGIAVPIFIPPVVAVVVSLPMGWRTSAPLAYIAGTLGTLIGGDLLNLHMLPGLDAPVASIGGAGTFDGVFLTGVLAVLLA